MRFAVPAAFLSTLTVIGAVLELPVQLPTLPIPTPPRPTLPLPTLPVPRIPLPTLPLPTLPLPTIPLPTLPTLTIPVPSDLPGLVMVNDTIIKFPDIMYFPDDTGQPTPGRVYGEVSMEPAQESDVFFRLYTRDGLKEGEIIIAGDADSLKGSFFNASQPTFIITHGYFQTINSNTIQSIKNMYVAYRGGNVIAVDWSKISKNLLYFIVKMQTVQVGQFVAAFVAFLVNQAGVSLSDVHLTGHSLGAHVVGIAGKNLRTMFGGKPARITGLDPAGPLFSVLDRERRLDRGDADFVDVIHTCGGWLGMMEPIGHVDFYPNGGTMKQPGCSWDFVLAGTCSHSRSWQFFAESINSELFSARTCSTYFDYISGNCVEVRRVIMGQNTPNSTKGIYFLQTAEFSPFGKG